MPTPEFYHQHDEQNYLINNPYLYDVFSLKCTLEQKTFATYEEASAYAGPYLEAINATLIDAEIIGQKVSLTGKDIVVAAPALNDETHTGHIESHIVHAGTDQEGDHAPIHGYLSNFYISICQNTSDAFIAELRNRILTHQNVVSDSFCGNLYATSPVATSTITFDEDRRSRIYVDALNALADTAHDAQTALTTATIEDLLTPEEEHELFDPYRLRKIGRAVRLLEKANGVNMAYRDNMIDLVGSRLGINGTTHFAIEAINSCMRGPSGAMHIPNGPLKESIPIVGLEFGPHYWISEGKPVLQEPSQETLSLVTHVGHTEDTTKTTKTLFIPLEKLRMFYPES